MCYACQGAGRLRLTFKVVKGVKHVPTPRAVGIAFIAQTLSDMKARKTRSSDPVSDIARMCANLPEGCDDVRYRACDALRAMRADVAHFEAEFEREMHEIVRREADREVCVDARPCKK
jgi:hypothetical protein